MNDNTDTRPLSVAHLVLGLVFLGIAGMWLLAEVTEIDAPVVTISGPAILIIAGTVGLLASLVNSRRRRTRDAEANAYDTNEEY